MIKIKAGLELCVKGAFTFVKLYLPQRLAPRQLILFTQVVSRAHQGLPLAGWLWKVSKPHKQMLALVCVEQDGRYSLFPAPALQVSLNTLEIIQQTIIYFILFKV